MWHCYASLRFPYFLAKPSTILHNQAMNVVNPANPMDANYWGATSHHSKGTYSRIKPKWGLSFGLPKKCSKAKAPQLLPLWWLHPAGCTKVSASQIDQRSMCHRSNDKTSADHLGCLNLRYIICLPAGHQICFTGEVKWYQKLGTHHPIFRETKIYSLPTPNATYSP